MGIGTCVPTGQNHFLWSWAGSVVGLCGSDGRGQELNTRHCLSRQHESCGFSPCMVRNCVFCAYSTGDYCRPGDSTMTKSKQWSLLSIISSSISEDLLYARPCFRYCAYRCELKEVVCTCAVYTLVATGKGHFWALRVDFFVISSSTEIWLK